MADGGRFEGTGSNSLEDYITSFRVNEFIEKLWLNRKKVFRNFLVRWIVIPTLITIISFATEFFRKEETYKNCCGENNGSDLHSHLCKLLHLFSFCNVNCISRRNTELIQKTKA